MKAVGIHPLHFDFIFQIRTHRHIVIACKFKDLPFRFPCEYCTAGNFARFLTNNGNPVFLTSFFKKPACIHFLNDCSQHAFAVRVHMCDFQRSLFRQTVVRFKSGICRPLPPRCDRYTDRRYIAIFNAFIGKPVAVQRKCKTGAFWDTGSHIACHHQVSPI